MRHAILVVVLVGGCKGGGGSGKPAGPAVIEASCVLGGDGANCTFTNSGGPGQRCVKVLYGSKVSGTVVSSDQVCSPKLAAGAVASLAVRFPRRPADACGEGAKDCTVKVVETAAAEEAAMAWQDELKTGGVGPLTKKECLEVGTHIVDVVIADQMRNATDDQKAQLEEYMKASRERMEQDFVQQCQSQMTRGQYVCAMKAKNTEEITRCEQQK